MRQRAPWATASAMRDSSRVKIEEEIKAPMSVALGSSRAEPGRRARMRGVRMEMREV